MQDSSKLDKNSENQTNINNIELIRWEPSAIWTWDVITHDCAICRSKLTNKCAECYGSDVVNRKCPVATGKCGHAFHRHCIQKWIKNGSNVCPIDKGPWSYDNNDLSNDPNSRKKIKRQSVRKQMNVPKKKVVKDKVSAKKVSVKKGHGDLSYVYSNYI